MDGKNAGVEINFMSKRISFRGAGSTLCWGCVEGLQLGRLRSVGVGRTIEFAIQGCEKIPCGSVFGFKLCRAFGVGEEPGSTYPIQRRRLIN